MIGKMGRYNCSSRKFGGGDGFCGINFRLGKKDGLEMRSVLSNEKDTGRRRGGKDRGLTLENGGRDEIEGKRETQGNVWRDNIGTDQKGIKLERKIAAAVNIGAKSSNKMRRDTRTERCRVKRFS